MSMNIELSVISANKSKLKDRPTLPADIIVVRMRRKAVEDVILPHSCFLRELQQPNGPGYCYKNQSWRCCLILLSIEQMFALQLSVLLMQ